MPTEAQKRARDKWDRENMIVLGCKVKRTDAERYKSAAAARGTTCSEVMRQALERMATPPAGDSKIWGAGE